MYIYIYIIRLLMMMNNGYNIMDKKVKKGVRYIE